MGIVVREDIDRAISLLEQSFAEFQALDEPLWQAISFYYLSSLLAKEGKLKEHDRILKVLTLARQAGERLFLASVLSDYADLLLCSNQVDKAREQVEESDRLYKQVGFHNKAANTFYAEIAWIEGNYEKAISLYDEVRKHFSLLGNKFQPALSTSMIGILALEEGDLERAGKYLETAVRLTQEVGYKPHIALRLAELSNLYYLQGNLEEFKQKFRESFSLKNYLAEIHKLRLLMTILGSLYPQKPENSSRLLGIINMYHGEDGFQFFPIEKRYCSRAETHVRKALGNTAFETAFASGQKMSLDEALDLALRDVEEM